MGSNRLDRLDGTNGSGYIVRSFLRSYHSKSISKHLSIKYAHNGSEFYILDGKRIELMPGHFLVVNPDQHVEIVVDVSMSVDGQCFFLNPGIISEIQSCIFKPSVSDLDGRDLNQFISEVSNQPIHASGTLLEVFFDGHRIDSLSSDLEVSDYIISLAESLFFQQYKQFRQLPLLQGKSLSTRTELFKRVERGRSFIHSNFSENISLDEIAAAGNLSPYHFHRNFRAFYQKTPHQYLLQLRMLNAHSLILKKNQSFSSIAFVSGFKDPKYFRKAYNKWLKRQAVN